MISNAQANKGSLTEYVSHDTQTLGEIQRSGSIETTSRVIPALNTSAGRHHLGNTNTFPLSARYAAYEFVPDKGLTGVRNVEHFQDGILNHGAKLFSGHTRETTIWPRSLGRECKFHRLSHRQCRYMDITWSCDQTQKGTTLEMSGYTFLIIGHFSPVVLGHLRGIDAGIPNIAPDGSVFASLISDRFEKGRAPSPRAA